MTLKEKLKKVIEKSSLNSKQKKLWRDLFIYMDNKKASHILLLLIDNYNNLEFLTNNLEEKKDAMKDGNKYKLEEILKKEIGRVSTHIDAYLAIGK